MRNLFPTLPNSRQLVSSGTLSALIQLKRQDLFTGLMEVMYPNDSRAILLFNVGSPFALFLMDDTIAYKIHPDEWGDVFARQKGSASLLPLSGDGLRACLLVLEGGAETEEEVTLRPDRMEAYLAEVTADTAISLLTAHAQAFWGVMILPGSSMAVQDSLTFTDKGVFSDPRGLFNFAPSGDQLIRLTRRTFREVPQSLNEYALRVIFLSLAQAALERFEQLAGDRLVDSLGFEINNFAYHQGWKIQFFGKRLLHQQFFPSVEEAAQVYRSMFRQMGAYMQLVTGASLMSGILTDGVASLPVSYRALYENQNIIVAAEAANAGR